MQEAGKNVLCDFNMSQRVRPMSATKSEEEKSNGLKPLHQYCKNSQYKRYSKAHEELNDNSENYVVNGSQNKKYRKPKVDMKGLDICEKHRENLKFFCADHEILCCGTCAFSEHRSCKEVNEISTQVFKANINSESLKETLSEVKTLASNILAFVKESTDAGAASSRLEPLLAMVDDIKKQLVKSCNDLKTEITEKFMKAQASINKENDGQETANQDIVNKVEMYNSILTSVLNNGSDEQKFIAMHLISEEIAGYHNSLLEQNDKLYKLDFSLEYSQSLTDLLRGRDDLASLVISKVNFDPEQPPEEKPMELILVASEDVIQGTDDVNEPFYPGMDFFPDGRLAVVDYWNLRLNIMDDSLETVGAYKFSGFRYDVAVVSDTEVAVTSGESYVIEFLEVSKTSEVILTKTVDTTSAYFSICLMNETTFIVSTVEEKRPARMITIDGQESDFKNIPKNEFNTFESYCAFVRNKETLVLTDRFADTVYLYNVGGDFTARCVVRDECIKEPCGACVGPEDCLFICSQNTHSLVQMSSTGSVIAIHELDMDYPCSICISKDGKYLAVSNNEIGKTKIQIYYLA